MWFENRLTSLSGKGKEERTSVRSLGSTLHDFITDSISEELLLILPESS